MVDSHAASSQGLKALKASLLAKKQQLIEVRTFSIPACRRGGGGNVDNTGGGGGIVEWWWRNDDNSGGGGNQVYSSRDN